MLSVIQVTHPTTVGLNATDLIAIISMMIGIFGLLLTGIGVLVLRQFGNLNDRITEVKQDVTREVEQFQQGYRDDLAAVWRELSLIRTGRAPPAAARPNA